MKTKIDLRAKHALKKEGVELSAKSSNYHAVKAAKKTALPFRNECIWLNRI